MQNPESVAIVERFFAALQALIETKRIRGKQTFCNQHDINRRNLWLLEKDKSRNIFQVSWLYYLVNDYNVSPAWLLTGQGDMFKP